MKIAVFICITVVVFSIAPHLSAQCAPASGDYQPPTGRTYNICVTQEHPVISTSTIDGAAALWGSGCGAVGSGVPNIVANPSNSFSCDMQISVSFNPDPHPNGYSAAFNWVGSTATSPPTLLGGQIVCHVNPCSDLLLAHELGHGLGLGDAYQSSCGGAIMMGVDPGSDFSEACNVADQIWLGPDPSDPDPSATGSGGGNGGEVLHRDTGDGGGGTGGAGSSTPGGSVNYGPTRCCFPDGTCISC